MKRQPLNALKPAMNSTNVYYSPSSDCIISDAQTTPSHVQKEEISFAQDGSSSCVVEDSLKPHMKRCPPISLKPAMNSIYVYYNPSSDCVFEDAQTTTIPVQNKEISFPQDSSASCDVEDSGKPHMTCSLQVEVSPSPYHTTLTKPSKVREDMFDDSESDDDESLVDEEVIVKPPTAAEIQREQTLAARQVKRAKKKDLKEKAKNKPKIPHTMVEALKDSACRRVDVDLLIDPMVEYFDNQYDLVEEDWNEALVAWLREYETIDEDFRFVRFTKYLPKEEPEWSFFEENRPYKIGVHFDLVKVLILLGDPFLWPRDRGGHIDFVEFQRRPVFRDCLSFWNTKNLRNWNQLFFRSYIIENAISFAESDGYNKQYLCQLLDRLMYSKKSYKVLGRNKGKMAPKQSNKFATKCVDDFRLCWPKVPAPRIPFCKERLEEFIHGETWFLRHFALPCEFIAANQSLLDVIKGRSPKFSPQVVLNLSIGKYVRKEPLKLENDQAHTCVAKPATQIVADHFFTRKMVVYEVSRTILMLLDRPLTSIKRSTFSQLCAEQKCPILAERVFAFMDDVDLGFQDWNDAYTWNQIIHHLVGKKLRKDYFKAKVDVDYLKLQEQSLDSFSQLKPGVKDHEFRVVFKPNGDITTLVPAYAIPQCKVEDPITYQGRSNWSMQYGTRKALVDKFEDDDRPFIVPEYIIVGDYLPWPLQWLPWPVIEYVEADQTDELTKRIRALRDKVRQTAEVPVESISDFIGDPDPSSGTILFIMRVAMFLGTLVREESLRHRAEMLFMLVSSIPDLQTKVYVLVRQLMLRAQQSFEYQAADENEAKSYLLVFKDIFLEKFCGPLFEKLRSVVTIVFQTTLKKLTEFSAQNIADALIGFVVEVFTRVQNCYNEGSLAPLFESAKSMQTWFVEARFVSSQFNTLVSVNYDAYKKMFDNGAIPKTLKNTPYQSHEIAYKIQQLLEQADGFLRFLTKPVIINEVRKLKDELTYHHMNLVKVMNHEPRVEPFFIYIGGQAGTGKTRITASISEKLCEDFHLSKDGIYTYVSGANFQDGLTAMHHTIVLDDVDIMPKEDSQYMKAIIDYKSSKPVQNEAADLVQKGSIYIQPWFMFMSSNAYFGHAESILPSPVAFARRVDIYMRPVPCEGATTRMGHLKPGKTPFGHVLFQEYEWDGGKAVDVGEPVPLKVMYDRIAARAREHRRIREPVKERCQQCGMPHCSGECTSFRHHVGDDVPEEKADEPIVLQAAAHTGNETAEAAWWIGTFITYFGPLNLLVLIFMVMIRPFLTLSVRAAKAYAWSMYIIARTGVIDMIVEELSAHWFKVKRFAFGCALGGLGLMLTKYMVTKDSDLLKPQGMVPNGNPEPPERVLPDDKVKQIPRTDWAHVPAKFSALAISSAGQTWTKEDVENALKANLITFKVDGVCMLHGLLIATDLILFPKHLLYAGDSNEPVLARETLTVVLERAGGTAVSMTVKEMLEANHKFNEELCILHCVNFPITRAVRHMIPTSPDVQVGQYDEAFIFTLGAARSGAPILNKQGVYLFPVSGIETESGQCGLPYYVRHGNAWWILGIHIGYMKSSKQAVSAMFYTAELPAIAKRFNVVLSEPGLVRQGLLDSWGTRPPTKRSEVWSMQTHNPRFFGHSFGYCSTVADTPRTKIKLSIGYEQFLKFADKYCGENYWRLPTFKGRMVPCDPHLIKTDDGEFVTITEKYVSPYTNAYETTNQVILPDKLVKIALACYLSGVRNLNLSDYKEMTPYECLAGLFRSDSVKAVNLDTSVGPPFNVSKRKMITRDDSRGGFVVDPKVVAIWNEIETLLEERKIPVVVSRSSLKDEPVKPDKVPRVFNVLPASFNLAAKRIGAWKYLMRCNPNFFECYVGIDMTSAAIMPMIDHFRAINPNLDKCSDFDVKALDKSFSNSMLELVAKAVYALSFALNIKPIENYLLIQSLRFIIHDIRGDFVMSPQNPSGYDATVEINSLALSLIYRMAWYKQHPPSKQDLAVIDKWWENFFYDPLPKFEALVSLNFRACNALAIYGDDTVWVTNETIWPTLFEDVKQISGLTLTAANKQKLNTPEVKHLTEIEFLKRTLTERDGSWYAPLSLKSIARMVLFKKHSTFSDRDHQCVTISDACREAFLHGEELYNEFTSVCKQVVETHGLAGNPWLAIPEFYDLVELYKNGHFTTFFKRADLENFSPTDTSDLIVFQSSKPQMSSINANYESIDSAPAKTQIENPLLTIVTPVEPISSSAPTTTFEPGKYSPVDTFMTPTEIARFTVGTGVMQMEYHSYPIFQWAATSDVQNRLKPFAQWKGNFQVHVTITAAPGGSGLVGMCVVPTGFNSVGKWPTVHNFCQCDLYALCDLSMSKGYTFDMPWIGPHECYDRDQSFGGKDARESWELFIFSLAPYAHPTQTRQPVCQIFVYPLAPLEIFGLLYQGKKPTDNPVLRQLTNQQQPGLMETVKAFAAKPVSTTLSTLAAVTAWLGHTKDLVPYTATTVKTFLASEPTSDGKFSGRKLNYTNATLVKPVISTDSQFESIANRWTLMATTLWQVSDSVGTLLENLAVSPFATEDLTDPSTGFFPLNGLSTAGYIGLPFQFWRGDVEYMFVFPANVYMRGKICLTYEPLPQTITTNNYPACLTRSRCTIVDIEQDKCVIVGLGFNSPTLFKDVEFVSNQAETINGGSTMGRLVMTVAAQLTNTIDSGSIRVCTFVRWKNVMFSGTRNKIGFSTTTAPSGIYPIALGAIKYQGAIGDEECENDVVNLQPGRPAPADYLTQIVNSPPMDCREMCQLRSHVVQYTLTPGTTTTIPTFAFNGLNDFSWSFASHYTIPFLGMTGSSRVTACTNQPTAILSVMPAVGFYSVNNTNLVNPLMQTEYFRPESTPTYEFEIPYSYPMRFATTTDTIYRGDPYASRLVLSTNMDSVWGVTLNPGADVSLHFFRFCPTILISKETAANTETQYVGCTRTLF